MRIQLSDHFEYRRIIRFVLPSIVMMICTSVYGVVDGLFVSNFVGKTPFAAVNLIMPFLMILGTVGFMLGTGGSAIVAKTLGEGDKPRAHKYFSMFVYTAIGAGIVISVLGIIFMPAVSRLLGAEGEMLENCILYGRIIAVGLAAYMLQTLFQSFFTVAEKPTLGLAMSVAAGVTNMVFDFVFIVVCKLGIAGAALATIMGQCVGGVFPLVYFAHRNNSLLKLVKARLDFRVLRKACFNGISEMLTNLSASIVSMLYNLRLMAVAGENGVAAYGTIMYVNFIFLAIFFGYAIGSAPIISYNYGAQRDDELKNVFKKSTVIIGVMALLLTATAELSSGWLTGIFVGYDAELYAMTVRGFRIYSIAFLIAGYNVFGSSLFTALNNGIISGMLSFLRTLVFQVIMVLTLPLILGLDGIWLSVVFAELLACAVTAVCVFKLRGTYRYL